MDKNITSYFINFKWISIWVQSSQTIIWRQLRRLQNLYHRASHGLLT